MAQWLEHSVSNRGIVSSSLITGILTENFSTGTRSLCVQTESAGKLSCYFCIFQDAQINISDAQFLNVVY